MKPASGPLAKRLRLLRIIMSRERHDPPLPPPTADWFNQKQWETVRQLMRDGLMAQRKGAHSVRVTVAGLRALADEKPRRRKKHRKIHRTSTLNYDHECAAAVSHAFTPVA